MNNPIILIVDDVPINLKILRAHLEPAQYDVLEAGGGEEALKKAEKQPDLILLDIMMPGMDGIETCKRLKANPVTKDIPVLFLSALNDADSKTGALKIGGADFISKPFDEEELLARVKVHLTMRQQQIQLQNYTSKLEKMVKERTKQLVHAERLATLGTFSTGIAHEINNPNTFIAANVQVLQLFWKNAFPLLKKHAHEDQSNHVEKMVDQIDDVFKDILEGSRRISSIVNSLKTYARYGGSQKEHCQLISIIQDVLRLLQHRLKKGVKIVTDIDEDLTLYCNPQNISQVFVNLINNSIDAMEDEKGTINLVAKKDNGNLIIFVQDDGLGISEYIAEKIFDPFFTTKGQARGTGLGLSIVKGIIEEHSGTISLQNPNKPCALFKISLPVAPVAGKEENELKF